MPGDPLIRNVLADQVRDRLLEDILGGEYPPDTRIIETAVARELQTSQAPVREALRTLEALGVVEITPFRGARVRRLQPDELLEAYVVRSRLETLAAELAVPRLAKADIGELVAFGQKMNEAAKAGDDHKLAEYDVSFHGRIVELSGNRTLLRVWRSLEPFSRTYLTLVMPGSDPNWTAGLHIPIVESLRRRDTQGVVRAIEKHFAEVSAVVSRRLAETSLSEPVAGGASPGGGSPGGELRGPRGKPAVRRSGRSPARRTGRPPART